MKLAVVGGGIAGLAAAHRAVELDPTAEVILVEGSERTGGLLRTERTGDGFVIERGAEAILSEKPAALELAKRVGLESRIVRTRIEARGAYIVSRGRLVRVPDGFSVVAPASIGGLLRSPILSPLGKLRAAMELALPRARPVPDESLAHFVRRRFGEEVLERLAQPLAGGIYGADPEALSLRATMPRFLELEASDRSVTLGLARRAKESPHESASGARYGMFFSFDGGAQVLPDAVAARLGDRIRTNAPVASIRQEHGRYRIELESGEIIDADALIVALPAYRAADLVGSIEPELTPHLRAIPYQSAATVTFAFRIEDVPHPLDAYGFVVPAIEGRPILASTFLHAKWPGRAPEGFALLRFFLGGHTRPDAPFASDDDMIATARREARLLMGIEAEPTLVRVDRFISAMPRYVVGHLERIDTIDRLVARHPRFALAGGAYRGVGIPDSVRSGEAAAAHVLG
ncbi:MAG: protoporphyrinogen oxidase [Polyangiaceae bacterium]|nr:protoporphyrinogen oxidase [Polyangiaceae bacterium]